MCILVDIYIYIYSLSWCIYIYIYISTKTCVGVKINNLKNKSLWELIHFKIFTFFLSLDQQKRNTHTHTHTHTRTQIYIYIYIYIYIIIIIMSYRQHGYPWPSLATSPYRSSPLAGLQGYIPNPHIAAVCLFELVVLLLPGHMYIIYELVLASPAVSCVLDSSNLDSFRDGRQVAV